MERKEWLCQKPIPDDVLKWGLKYTYLMNKDYLTRMLETHTQWEVAKEIGCTTKLLRKAMAFHNITMMPGHNSALKKRKT